MGCKNDIKEASRTAKILGSSGILAHNNADLMAKIMAWNEQIGKEIEILQKDTKMNVEAMGTKQYEDVVKTASLRFRWSD